MENNTKSNSNIAGSANVLTLHPSGEQINLKSFLEQLSIKERRAYEIAKNHLGMSFQLEKSVGYLKWKTQQQI